MLTYKEMENVAAVEIVVTDLVSTKEFDRTARKLEAFIARHGRVRVLEIGHDFEGLDAGAFWQDLKFSLRHLIDYSRCAIVSDAKWLTLSSIIAQSFVDCEVSHFPPDEIEVARDWLLWPESAPDEINGIHPTNVFSNGVSERSGTRVSGNPPWLGVCVGLRRVFFRSRLRVYCVSVARDLGPVCADGLAAHRTPRVPRANYGFLASGKTCPRSQLPVRG